jgi:hypothetical protein
MRGGLRASRDAAWIVPVGPAVQDLPCVAVHKQLDLLSLDTDRPASSASAWVRQLPSVSSSFSRRTSQPSWSWGGQRAWRLDLLPLSPHSQGGLRGYASTRRHSFPCWSGGVETLRAAGVDDQLLEVAGMSRAFFRIVAVVDVAREAVDKAGDALRAALSDAPRAGEL